MLKEVTEAEKFRYMCEEHSASWYNARDVLAQEFLDRYVLADCAVFRGPITPTYHLTSIPAVSPPHLPPHIHMYLHLLTHLSSFMRQNIPEIDEIMCESDLSYFKLSLTEDLLYKEQQQFLELQDMKSTRTGKVRCLFRPSSWRLGTFNEEVMKQDQIVILFL